MYLSSSPSAVTLAFVQCHHRFLSSEDFKSYALIIELMEVYMTQYGYKKPIENHSATAKKKISYYLHGSKTISVTLKWDVNDQI